MDKLLRDIEAFCELRAEATEKRYRESCLMAEISEKVWKEQQLTDEEMAMIKSRNDTVNSILFHDSDVDTPHYGKTCEETLQDIVGELQGMIELIEYIEKIEDCRLQHE